MSTERRSAGRGDLLRAPLAALVFVLFSPADAPPVLAQGAGEPAPPSAESEPPAHDSEGDTALTVTISDQSDAGDMEGEAPRRKLIRWNELDGPYSTFRLGMAFLTDFTTFAQDDESEQQFDLESDEGVRDFRLLFSGKFKTKRDISWSAGVMYDGADEVWRIRQTGILVGLPELNSKVFFGRIKEGYSMIKVLSGPYGWTMERSPAEDAFVPILADGVKWFYYQPDRHVFGSLGAYVDTLSEDEKFSTYDDQWVGRIGLQPRLSEERKEVLHVAVMGRWGHPDEGFLQVKSKPENNLAPNFLDTGRIEADTATTLGYEVYYRKGPWLFGTEYNWLEVDDVAGEGPVFHGGDAVVTWLITGETRPYNPRAGIFGMISPDRTVFEGGWGALEAVFRVSYSDFTEGSYQGGRFWRVTPMLNWYLTDNLRLELAYGYGELDRFGVTGVTQFLQARVQFTF